MKGCYRCGKSRRGRRVLLCRPCEAYLDDYRTQNSHATTLEAVP